MSESKSDYRFRPIRGLEDDLKNVPHTEGALLIATDTGKMWFDTPSYRISLGGGSGSGTGTSIMYSQAGTIDPDSNGQYTLSFDDLEDNTVKPSVGTVLINTDGTFYRVLSVDSDARTILCAMIAVSGGTGGGSKITSMELVIDKPSTTNLINGKPFDITFTATSAKKTDGSNYDDTITVAWYLSYTENGGTTYTTSKQSILEVNSGEKASLDIGSYAKQSASCKLTLVASQLNAPDGYGEVTRTLTFSTSSLELSKSATFSNISYFTGNKVTLSCNVSGNMDKILEYWWSNGEEDQVLLSTVNLTADSVESQSLDVQTKTTLVNGYHKVTIRLFQSINGNKGLEVDPLNYEVAYWDNKTTDPIIWLGSYDSTYYEYDNIQIPFRVFDPSSTDTTTVHLYKDNVEMASSPRKITDTTAFSIFEITNTDKGIQNYYSISCGETKRDIFFNVVDDTTRPDFGIQRTEALVMSFDSKGRSNSESATNREIVSDSILKSGDDYVDLDTKFTNFNWYNNGWVLDSDTGNTCLRISNGASFGINLGTTTFAGGSSGNLSHTFEFQFKIRNVQDYSSLIHNVTRYKNDGDGAGEYGLYSKFYDSATNTYKTKYSNYDSFLTDYLKNNYVAYTYTKDSVSYTRALTYDDLEFDHIEKQINLSAVACGYYSGSSSAPVGICLGPQDAFFSNGTNTVNVSYVENEMVNLAVVYNDSNKLMYIYINGVLTGIIKSTQTSAFEIAPTDGMMAFNSNYCDIDLYKVRVYNNSLTVNDIVMNYAFDLRNATIYDQNKLASENTVINEFQLQYNNMISYNNKHASAPLMPYIIFDTKDSVLGDKLPFSKKVPISVGVEFVNTALDRAYESGELEALAKADGLWKDSDSEATKVKAIKNYYMHHCPSWIGDNITMSVQGTSSEFYPRRNYKLKTKTERELDKTNHKKDKDAMNEAAALDNSRDIYKTYVNMMMNRGPFATDYAADIAGYDEDPCVLSADNFDADTTYYEDVKGENEIELTAATYEKNKYYVANSAYRKFGKENTRLKYFYFDNYTAGTTKFTMKIDFMESSGSYNMGLANLVKNAYSKHPLEDYQDVMRKQTESYALCDKDFDPEEDYYVDDADEDSGKKQVFFYRNPDHYAEGEAIKDVTGEYTYEKGKFYTMTPVIATENYNLSNTDDYRTSVQGFRVMAFHKRSDETYQYIGMYNMLLDKGADEAFGFKPDKVTGDTIVNAAKKNKKVPSVAECWEFENNNRTFCSFRDPLNRKELSFDVYDDDGNRQLNSVKSAPLVADSFEYRYNKKGDVLDYIIDPTTNADKLSAALDEYPTYGDYDLQGSVDDRCDVFLDLSKNWETAVKWVWSTNTEVVPSQGVYSEVQLGKVAWTADTYYIQYVKDDGTYDFKKDDGTAYDSSTTYYNQVTTTTTITVGDDTTTTTVSVSINGAAPTTTSTTAEKADGDKSSTETVVSYENGWVSDEAHKYEVDTYYLKDDSEYVLSSDDFDESATYYDMEVLAGDDLDKIADILVAANGNTSYDSTKRYFTYNKNAICDKTKPTATAEVTGADLFVKADDVTGVTFETFANYYVKSDDNFVALTSSDIMKAVETQPTDEEFAAGTYYNKTEAGAYIQATVNSDALFVFDASAITEVYIFRTDLYVPSPVKYGKTTYTHDTQEYRAAKFTNELEKHFDMEYLATYFVVTEVLELYDSRGKNCMMASWGPKASKGEYIWYPIFYDMDTQLGINNTGIPSFEYNVDATEDGNFSTSDSVLWNNFYKYYKKSKILEKYKHLRGTTAGVSWTTLSNPPFNSVDKVESWYSTDPDVCDSIAMRGERPLIAINLDEYYKYITITNSASYTNGITGHISSDQNGDYTYDAKGTYFYALQGDRSLSRRQFLTNRFEYIDSWLNQGNYQRGGANRIRGRVAANNGTKTSDQWVASALTGGDNPYFDTDGNKTHLFDAEYWITLTPMRSSYVTISDDNEAYPSVKYDGINPVKFDVTAIQSGVTTSNNYPEQLLYVYGLNQMKDLGDMSNLYWQEFEISGDASKLSTLKLGYDGLMTDANGELVEAPADATGNGIVTVGEHKYYKWYNNKVNEPSIPASSDATGMPLLKEVNFSNMQINTGSPTLDLTSCEKLQNFRATGSNLTAVYFAKGVALNTLYLPTSITSLDLTEARLLTKLITKYSYPTRNKAGDLEAVQGLYLEGMFENNSTKIASLSLTGGSLGYDSLKLLNKYYAIRSQQSDSTSAITMTDVVWTPYKQLGEGDVHTTGTKLYFIDDGHFGFKRLYDNADQAVAEGDSKLEHGVLYNAGTWETQVLNGEIYKLDDSVAADTINQITDLSMLVDLAENPLYKSTASQNNSIPNITGTIFINNDEYMVVKSTDAINEEMYTYYTSADGTTYSEYDPNAGTFVADAADGKVFVKINETYVRNTLQGKYYPDVNFFFANIEQAYTAKFILQEEDGSYQVIGLQTISSGWFTNPIDAYGDISDKKANYDFYGWADKYTPTNEGASILVNLDKSTDTWSSLALTENKHDYTFYAIFSIHEYAITFHDPGHTDPYIKYIAYGQVITGPDKSKFIPYKSDAELADTLTYKFAGWSLVDGGSMVDLSTYRSTKNRDFYAVFDEASVYDNVMDESLLHFDRTTYTGYYGKTLDGYSIKIDDDVNKDSIVGKITIPSYHEGLPVVDIAASGFAELHYVTHVFFEKDNALGACKLLGINDHGFSHMYALKKIYLPDSLDYMDSYSLNSSQNLETLDFTASITYMSNLAINTCFSGDLYDNLYLSGDLRHIGTNAINNAKMHIKELIIGSKDKPSQLHNAGGYPNEDALHVSSEKGVDKVTIYCSAEDEDFYTDLIASGYLGSSIGSPVD